MELLSWLRDAPTEVNLTPPRVRSSTLVTAEAIAFVHTADEWLFREPRRYCGVTEMALHKTSVF